MRQSKNGVSISRLLAGIVECKKIFDKQTFLPLPFLEQEVPSL